MKSARRHGLVAVAAVLVLAAAFAAPVFADPASDLLGVGRKAFADSQYTLAASSFQRIEDEYPDSAAAEEASYLRGVSLFYLGRWSEALSTFSLLGIRHPGSAFVARAAYWSGAANLKLGNWQNALDSLTEFLGSPAAAAPYLQSAILYRAVALEGLGRDSDAADIYRKILASSPSADQAGDVTYRLAGIELRGGRYEAARDLYGRILLSANASPFVPDAVFYTGECELALGNILEAERRYRTVLSLYPDSQNLEASTFRLADISWRQRRDSDLLQVEDYLARFPTGNHRGSALKLRADILVERKRSSEAVSEYTRAVVLLPDGMERQSAFYSMALAQLSLGKKLDAADSFAHAATGGLPDVAEKAGFQRAVILADSGRVTEAIEALRAFLAAFPGSSRAEEAGRLLGTLLEKQGDRESARASWDWLVDRFPLSPSRSEYVYRRGSALLAAGRWTSALDDFQSVLKDIRGSLYSARSAYSIGYVYARQGEYPRALPFFQAASQAVPPGPDSARARLSAAICLFDMGRFSQALDALRSLQSDGTAAANPRSTGAASAGTLALFEGRSLYRMERLADAAAALGGAAAALAAEGSPLGADALYWRGWALLRLQKPAEAGSAFLAVAEGYPADPRRLEALFRAAVCQTLQSDDAAALTLFDQVISRPDSTSDSALIREQAMYERALALSRLGREEEAANTREDLARAFPASRLAAQAFYARAERAFSEKRFAEATEGFNRVQRDFPRSPFAAPASYWAAEASFLAGDDDTALDGFWVCLTLPPGALAPSLLSAAVDGFEAALRKTADADVARTYAQRVATATGMSEEAAAGVRLAAAELLMAAAPEEARGLLDQVSAAAPPEPYAGEASLFLGMYAESKWDWNRALDILDSLEGSRADDVGARAALEKGRVLETMGRTSDAVDEYLKVGYLFPDFADRAAEGMANAVRLSRARGDADRAVRIERALRAAYPDSPWLQSITP